MWCLLILVVLMPDFSLLCMDQQGSEESHLTTIWNHSPKFESKHLQGEKSVKNICRCLKKQHSRGVFLDSVFFGLTCLETLDQTQDCEGNLNAANVAIGIIAKFIAKC